MEDIHILSVILNFLVLYELDTEAITVSNEDKTMLTYTKTMLINNIAAESEIDAKTVRTIYNILEKDISKLLSLANEDVDVSLRLFEGITIGSTFVPEKTKVNNLTGEVITTSSKIKPKANITRYYADKINHNK